MVDTTPARTEHTFLRRLYDTIWATKPPAHYSARDRYYTTVALSHDAWQRNPHAWADVDGHVGTSRTLLFIKLALFRLLKLWTERHLTMSAVIL
jgi:hypothetical protein